MKLLQSDALFAIVMICLVTCEVYFFGIETAFDALAVGIAFFVVLKYENLKDNYLVIMTTIPLSGGIIAVSTYSLFSSYSPFENEVLIRFQGGTPFAAIIQIVSTLYAVSIAFLLVKGIQRYSDLNKAVQNKNNQIVLALDNLVFLEPDNVQDLEDSEGRYYMSIEFYLRLKLISYLVLFRNYLTINEKREQSGGLRSSVFELRTMASQLTPKPNDANDEFAMSQMIENLNSLVDLGNEIEAHLKDRMSNALMTFIAITSALCNLFFFDQNFSASAPLTYAIFVMALLFCFIFLLLVDINDPFRGQWVIDSSCIGDAIESEEEKARKRSVTFYNAISSHINSDDESHVSDGVSDVSHLISQSRNNTKNQTQHTPRMIAALNKISKLGKSS